MIKNMQYLLKNMESNYQKNIKILKNNQINFKKETKKSRFLILKLSNNNKNSNYPKFI